MGRREKNRIEILQKAIEKLIPNLLPGIRKTGFGPEINRPIQILWEDMIHDYPLLANLSLHLGEPGAPWAPDTKSDPGHPQQATRTPKPRNGWKIAEIGTHFSNWLPSSPNFIKNRSSDQEGTETKKGQAVGRRRLVVWEKWRRNR